MSGPASLLDLYNLTLRRALWLLAWFVATLILGTLGYLEYAIAEAKPISGLTALYHTAQLFILHAPHFEGHLPITLEVARWSAAIFTLRTVLGAGHHLVRRERGFWQLRNFNRHVIVCGLGRRGVDCVRFERSKPADGRDVVVIDRAPPADLVEECEALGARVLTGDATDPRVLERAGIARASALFALLGDDGANSTVATRAREIIASSGPRHEPLSCSVHLSSLDLKAVLEDRPSNPSDGSRIDVRYFDLFDLESRRILLHALPIDHDGVRYAETRRVHLVILGFGRMGRAVALRAAKVGHFANAVRDPKLRLRVSVIDRDAADLEPRFMYRHGQYRSCCDIEFHALDVESPAAVSMVEGWCSDPDAMCSVVVCFDDDVRVAAVAVKLIPAMKAHGVRVALRLARRTGLGSVMEAVRRNGIPSDRMQPFGVLDENSCNGAFTEDEHESVARAIHANYRAGKKKGDAKGDPADRDWRYLTEVLRESNRQQAHHMPIKLRTIGCETVPLSDPRPAVNVFTGEVVPGLTEHELLARMEHDRWNAERWLDGWTYADGPKNVELRTSPYLVPWQDVPAGVKQYDMNAVQLIPQLLASGGMKACRRGAGR